MDKESIDYSNPEPPLEIVNIRKDDLIGGTMFSKHWLFEFLLKLIKVNMQEIPFINSLTF